MIIILFIMANALLMSQEEPFRLELSWEIFNAIIFDGLFEFQLV